MATRSKYPCPEENYSNEKKPKQSNTNQTRHKMGFNTNNSKQQSTQFAHHKGIHPKGVCRHIQSVGTLPGGPYSIRLKQN